MYSYFIHGSLAVEETLSALIKDDITAHSPVHELIVKAKFQSVDYILCNKTLYYKIKIQTIHYSVHYKISHNY